HSPSLFLSERHRSALVCAAIRPACAVAPSLLLPSGASFVELLHVRVELRLVLRRERRTDLGSLALHQRLKLLPISCRAIPRRLQRHAVLLLSRGPHVLHRWPERL